MKIHFSELFNSFMLPSPKCYKDRCQNYWTFPTIGHSHVIQDPARQKESACSVFLYISRFRSKFIHTYMHIRTHIYIHIYIYINKDHRVAWVTQLVERPTLNFGSGHDPRVEPRVGLLAEHEDCLRFSLSFSLSPCVLPLLVHVCMHSNK